jgi:uncharacterized protein (DUF58 family)
VSRVDVRRLPLVGALVRSYEDRLTARGRALLWTAAAFGLVGLDTRRSQVYLLFAVPAAALFLAMLLEPVPAPKVRFELTLPFRATALVPVTLHARVTGLGSRYRDLCLSFPRVPGSRGRLVFDPPESFLAAAPAATSEVSVTLRPERRGRYELDGPTLRMTDPLRLATSRAVRAADTTLLVYPRFFRLDDFQIPLGRRYQPGGIPLTSSTGDAIEFVGTRDYREGDAIRNIHWRSWARRGAPVVKEYQEEYFCRIAIVLDTFVPEKRTPRDEAAFEAGVTLVASIADYFSRSEYIVDILAAGPDVYEVSAGRSLAYLDNILDVLACLEPCRDPPFSGVGPHLFEKLEQITTVVAILQDWDEPRLAFLRRVKAQGTAVRAIVVRDGATAVDWAAAAGDFDDVSQRTVASIDEALARSGVTRG